MIVTAWLFGPLFNLARKVPTTSVTSDGFCFYHLVWPNRFWFVFTSVINTGLYFFFPFTFIMILYISIFIRLRKMAQGGPLGKSNNKQSETMGRAKDNVFKTLLFLSACFFLCYVWNISFYLLFSVGVPLSTTTPFYNFSVFMVNVNCCVNPFCYAVQYREFQEQVKHLFCKSRLPRDTSSGNTCSTSVSQDTQDTK